MKASRSRRVFWGVLFLGGVCLSPYAAERTLVMGQMQSVTSEAVHAQTLPSSSSGRQLPGTSATLAAGGASSNTLARVSPTPRHMIRLVSQWEIEEAQKRRIIELERARRLAEGVEVTTDELVRSYNRWQWHYDPQKASYYAGVIQEDIAKFDEALAGDDSFVQAAAIGRNIQILNMLCPLDVIETMTVRLRRESTRLADGEWALRCFYSGMDGWFSRRARSQGLEGARAELQEWCKMKPRLHAPRLAEAAMLQTMAWEARGSGSIDTVTPEGLKKFHELLRQAMQILVDCEKLPEADPEIYAREITVAMGLGLPSREVAACLARGMEVNPDYPALYAAMTYYLLPRWYGEEGDVARFATAAADKLTSHGDEVYARIAWSLAGWKDYEPLAFFRDSGFSYERVKRGYLDLLKRYPRSLRLKYQLQWFACVAGDRETARQADPGVAFAYQGDGGTVWGAQGTYAQWREWSEGRRPRSNISRMLMRAAAKGELDTVEALLPGSGDINGRDFAGSTLLTMAMSKNQPKVVELLLSRGADLQTTTADNRSPLLEAALTGNLEVARKALEAGAPVDLAESNNHYTPLHYAATTTSTQMVELLLAHKADLHARSGRGCTPLHLAADSGRDQVIEVLLKAGADVNACGKPEWGKPTSLDFALRQGRSATAELLRKHGGQTASELNAKRAAGVAGAQSATTQTAVAR